ncbi:MAG: TetR/AcrR family transcriptional regulator, partial [Bacteroidia bacterium]|nr:TetR/AcrR family transcriptional regulator [Bacteroidia bacterium]
MTKEEEIIKAAEEEFFRNGYDASSTAIIAKRAGVTHAMVNYYFRTKERLFVQILDNHVYELLRSLKPLMQDKGNLVEVSVDAAVMIFDKLNEDRRFPYLLSDISRTHPDFLLRYKDTFDTVCMDSIKMHSQRLEKSIREGLSAECTMQDIYNTVLSLAVSPFLTLPVLENVAGFSTGDIDSFLQSRKEEMVK